MKQYKAVYFDWDGTAVLSRLADADRVLTAMISVLKKGIKLIIISGTTYENICGGKLGQLIPRELLQNLYLGLARGNYNYGFDAKGRLVFLSDQTPSRAATLKLHDAAYGFHHFLLKQYNLSTDIVFSRPNYCKIDLMTESKRDSNALYLQGEEVKQVNQLLVRHGMQGGLSKLLFLAEGIAPDLGLRVTTDAKYVELGYTTKSDNVNYFMTEFSSMLSAKDCCFWGDEFGAIAPDVWGSDQRMITAKTKGGDFFSVSDAALPLPDQVKHLGGGPEVFLHFLNQLGKE